jgi:1-deoxy-D-xylulose-5-phosphate reductoisomerase
MASGDPVRVALLGSTGSIGRQTLDVLAGAGSAFRVIAMSAGRDAASFAAQVAAVRPAAVTMADRDALAGLLLPAGTSADPDPDAAVRFATRDDVDVVVVATRGVVSLRPVLAALEAGKVVATANKETLVAGGHLVMPLARDHAARVARRDPADPLASPLAWVRPIDSEHSALWQCLAGEDPRSVARLVLTASGGPFLRRDAASLASATSAEALGHPTWRMGAKITVDSATLMNKGLEVIEAHWLYDARYDDIDVLIHPQSLVHSLVEFVDGSMKAQLGLPDMRIPIQYALTWPARTPGPAPRLDLLEHATLTFEAPDLDRFPLLRVAREAGVSGPRASAALIAADEVAVSRFLDGSIDWPGQTRLVSGAVERFGTGPDPDLPGLVALDAEVRAWGAAA